MHRKINISDIPQIPCVPHTCGDPSGIIENIVATPLNDTAVEITCKQQHFYLEGKPNVPGAWSMIASCLQRPGKLPIWKIDGVDLKDSPSIICRDGTKCVDPPKDFKNPNFIKWDYDGEVHENGTTFDYYCQSPSNETIHLNFTTPTSKRIKMMNYGKMMKLEQIGKTNNDMQLIRFRVTNFEFIRIIFTKNRILSTKDFPIIEVSKVKTDFARHLQHGVAYSKQFFMHDLPEDQYDFFILIDGVEVIFGKFVNYEFETIGFYHYADLDYDNDYIGFSSTNDAEWIVEKGKIMKTLMIVIKTQFYLQVDLEAKY